MADRLTFRCPHCERELAVQTGDGETKLCAHCGAEITRSTLHEQALAHADAIYEAMEKRSRN